MIAGSLGFDVRTTLRCKLAEEEKEKEKGGSMFCFGVRRRSGRWGRGHTTEPLEVERWMEWMRVARVLSRSRRMSEQMPGLEAGLSTGGAGSYSSSLKPSSSISSTMFFRK
ncbi:hypothetical protein EYF80_048846 [Liparis tanakae]|uniref:Uncharacterized protein n=1 Tax=Liparis tanakae TaxID=230148 RepID=A0A4Z2FL29_9TELE|nr:hypothetical protein EYF80_048846 [Liparis tanakae]